MYSPGNNYCEVHIPTNSPPEMCLTFEMLYWMKEGTVTIKSKLGNWVLKTKSGFIQISIHITVKSSTGVYEIYSQLNVVYLSLKFRFSILLHCKLTKYSTHDKAFYGIFYTFVVKYLFLKDLVLDVCNRILLIYMIQTKTNYPVCPL